MDYGLECLILEAISLKKKLKDIYLVLYAHMDDMDDADVKALIDRVGGGFDLQEIKTIVNLI